MWVGVCVGGCLCGRCSNILIHVVFVYEKDSRCTNCDHSRTNVLCINCYDVDKNKNNTNHHNSSNVYYNGDDDFKYNDDDNAKRKW